MEPELMPEHIRVVGVMVLDQAPEVRRSALTTGFFLAVYLGALACYLWPDHAKRVVDVLSRASFDRGLG